MTNDPVFEENINKLRHLLYSKLFIDPYWRSKEISNVSTFEQELRHIMERLDLEIKQYRDIIKSQNDTIIQLVNRIQSNVK